MSPGKEQQASLNFLGRRLMRLANTLLGMAAFALIVLGVAITKWRMASRVMFPVLYRQLYHGGIRLFPIVAFLGFALGFVIIGQMVALLSRVGAVDFAGMIMVPVVVRELGPVMTALIVLGRVGTAAVIDLGTSRAAGEVEALEALGIDPVHYLVLPRILSLVLGCFSLTIYLILIALLSGFLFAFIQDVPILPSDYFNQLASSLRWEDFILLALKTSLFGFVIGITTCYEGLARPLRLEHVSDATTRAVEASVITFVLLDALFLLVYLLI